MERPSKSERKYEFPSSKLKIRSSPRPTAILVECGSFSPVTYMHLRLLEQCRDHLKDQFDIIGGFLSPVGDSYNKKGLESSFHRINMLEKAVEDSSWLAVDPWESEQEEYQSTVVVLKHFKDEIDKLFPKNNVRVILSCGADLLSSFNRPGVWQDEDVKEIVQTYGVVCLEREGLDLNKTVFDNMILFERRRNIHFVPQTVLNAISSTTIRKSIKRNLSISYLVPSSVEKYIIDNKLYRDDALEQKTSIFGNY